MMNNTANVGKINSKTVPIGRLICMCIGGGGGVGGGIQYHLSSRSCHTRFQGRGPVMFRAKQKLTVQAHFCWRCILKHWKSRASCYSYYYAGYSTIKGHSQNKTWVELETTNWLLAYIRLKYIYWCMPQTFKNFDDQLLSCSVYVRHEPGNLGNWS